MSIAIAPQKEMKIMHKEGNKRFSIRIKLVLIFGALITIAAFMLGLLSMVLAKKAVTEKVNTFNRQSHKHCRNY